MKEQQQPIVNNWVDIRQPGMAGMNTIVDQHDIKDQEAVDLQNMWFDQGVIGNRPGYKLFASKPTNETGEPLQIMVGKTSDGINYLISVYTSGTSTNKFYLWDSINDQWIPINGTALPSFTETAYFGSQSWDYGYAFDALYFCNGYDDMCKWRMSLDYIAEPVTSSDTTLTLEDASRFYIYSAGIATVADTTTVTLNASPEQNALYVNDWELGQMVYYTGSGISGLVNDTIYYAVPTAYSLPTNGVSGNSLGFAATLADAIAKNTVSISGSPTDCVIYKAEPLVIQDGSSTYMTSYYNRSGNVLSLTSAIGSNANVGAAVAPTITDRPGCPKGNIITTWQSRMVVANSPASSMSIWNTSNTVFTTYPTDPTTAMIISPTIVSGSGNTMWLSRVSAPEDYITNQDDLSSGGNQIFNDGAGSITDIKDFGEFLVVSKSNIQYRFDFVPNQDLSAQFPQVVPIISGIGMGPFNTRSSLKALNAIYYPTSSSGFIQLSPLGTGVTSSTGVQVISFNINNLIQSGYNFNTSKGAFFYNKLFWTATNPETQDVVFMYDTIRSAWTKFDNWNPADMAVLNSNTMLFLSRIDGNIYQAFSGYTDNNNPYLSYYKTKLHNFGKPALVKTLDAIYVEGYMTQSTTLYADVLYNEKGILFSKTYTMQVNKNGFIFTNVNIDALGQIPINQGILDSLTPSQIQSFGYFRTFLSVPNSFGLFALQITFRSKDPAVVWFITGYAMNPQYENPVPPTMRLDPDSEINMSQSSFNNGGTNTLPTGQTVHVETPTGTIDGVNITFTVTHVPLAVVLNGTVYFPGDGYTISGLTITMLVIPVVGSTLRSLYSA